mgnify:FL=1|tara:strand:+ start:229 stop:1584 length:1356 start_codon:yes stop_codon:yes gene_type:complete
MNKLPNPSTDNFDFSKPTIDHIILDNKINLYQVTKPNSELLTLVFVLPIANETIQSIPSGSVNLSLKLFFEQNIYKSNTSLQHQLENSGADPIYSSDTEKIIIGFQASFNNWEKSLDILLGALESININSQEFNRIKKLRIGEILQNQGNPMFLARSGLLKNLYKDTSTKSYPSIGKLSDINEIEHSTILNISTRLLRITEQSKVTLICKNQNQKLIHKLSNIKIESNTKELKIKQDKQNSENLLISTNIQSPQSVILFGKRLTIPNMKERVCLEIFNEIFGGSFMSRLNVNLREKNGYSYGFGSSLSWSNNKEPTIIAGGSVNSKNTSDSIEEINYEIDSLFNKNELSKEELQNAIFSIKLGYLKNFETHMSSISLVNKIIFENLNLNYHDLFFDLISNITKDEIYSYIHKNFSNLNDFSTIVVGDEKYLSKLIVDKLIFAKLVDSESII